MLPEIRFSPLELKDTITIIVSCAALITAISTAMFNRNSTNAKFIEDARKEMTDAIKSLADLRVKNDELRRELGQDFFDVKAMNRRTHISEQRNFHLHRALSIIDSSKIRLTSFDNLLIAVTMLDSGRNKQAVQYYKLAYETAVDDFDQATMKRVYGRSLIITGRAEEGQDTMIASISDFEKLIGTNAYQDDRLWHEVVDTYHRIIGVSLDCGYRDGLANYLDPMRLAAGYIGDKNRKNLAMSMYYESCRMIGV